MNDMQFVKRLNTLEQRVGLLPSMQALREDSPSRTTMPSASERLGVVLVLAPFGVIGGLLTQVLLDQGLPDTALSVLLLVVVALGHVLLLGALAVAVASWKHYSLLVYGLASALFGYALTSLGHVVT